MKKNRLLSLLLLMLLPLCALAEEVPYRQRVTCPDERIFSAPHYDADCVGTVGSAGVYTIVEEREDGEGNLWGRLKSGAGWIDLTHVRAPETMAQPLSVSLPGHGLQSGSTGHFCLAERSEYTTWLLFRAAEPLTDFRLVPLEMADAGFIAGEPLTAIPQMAPGECLLAGLVFPGDMSAYGLLFADGEGMSRCLVATLSGRNGLPLLYECETVTDAQGRLLLLD